MDPSEEIPETHFQSQNLKKLLSTLNLSKNDFGHMKESEAQICIPLRRLRNCHYYLVGGIPTPLKNMSSSVGMMKFPKYGTIKLGLIFPTIWKVIKFHGSKPPTIAIGVGGLGGLYRNSSHGQKGEVGCILGSGRSRLNSLRTSYNYG